ncbi:MAG TPA: FAD-dependent oxidoreductase [Ktedonobacteraceae bacterium]|nr:FAD-dependent oxidoreductase [Ktedonobacteraceae bacterium]
MYQPQIIIVGAGIVGLSTAYALLDQGMKNVTVLEQAAVDHDKGTSHGTSRLLRFEYGSNKAYSQMVQLSLNLWRQLEVHTNRTFYTRTGILALGNLSDQETEASYHILKDLGLPMTLLNSQEHLMRFPQFNKSDFDYITYNPEAGILNASAILKTLKTLIRDRGGIIGEATRVIQLKYGKQHEKVSLVLENNDSINADHVVVATGPWVHRLLADLQLPVRLSRQYLLYFDGLPMPGYEINNFPAFVANDLYGFPVHKSSSGKLWLKAASHSFGPTIDPDDPPTLDAQAIGKIQNRLQNLIPALHTSKLAHVEAWMYDVSPDEDFILDHVPDDPRVIFATGLTGHGFKFGLLLGKLLSSLVLNTPPPISMERFHLKRFSRILAHVSRSVA